MKRFSVGDTVEWETGGKLYKAIVIETNKTEFTVDVFFPLTLKNLHYTYTHNGWILSAPVDKGKVMCDKIQSMYERQPYVQRIKQ